MSKSSHLPPVPPANRSNKGPGRASRADASTGSAAGKGASSRNVAEQDRPGNVQQNTTNQGYQQDR